MQKVTVNLVCDLPHPKEVAATKTIRFTLDGSAFELDTCAYDAQKMHATMAPFIGAARPEVKAKPKPQARGRSQKKHAQVVREWAAAHDMPVGARGRIPARVAAAYATDQVGKPAGRAAMTVIRGKPRAGKPAGGSTAKATAV
jgi:hypothetical protein